MVAAAESVKSRQCTAPEHYFARLIAFDGIKPSRAYALAWKVPTANASDLAARVLARPHVIARIAELRAQADREGCMAMGERRRLLAETARSVSKGEKATHGDRIAAIREDAILAGERRTDSSQISIAAEVSIVAVLGALNGFGLPAAAAPRTVAPVTEQQGGQAASCEPHKLEIAGSSPAPASNFAPAAVAAGSLQDPWEIAAELPPAPAQPMTMVEIDEDSAS